VREGRFQREIEQALGVRATVIEEEIQHIYSTLGVADLLSLAFYAHHHDLKPLSEGAHADQATNSPI